MYDFWSQEAGGGYAFVTLASPCTPTDVLAARAFHVVEDNATENAEWQAALEDFVEDVVAPGNVVMVSLEWQDLENCDDWQSTGVPTAACPASTSMAALLGATVTAADVQACNAGCGESANCSYALIAVRGRNGGPAVSEFLNCTRVEGCGYKVLYAGGGCQSDEFLTFDHAEVLGSNYTVEECYDACRDIAWCEQFASGVSGTAREGDCLVYSGQCSSQSADTALVTYEMLPCSAKGTVDLAAGWEYQAAAAWNVSDATAVDAATTAEAEDDSTDNVVGAGLGLAATSTAAGRRCFQRNFHDEFDVRVGEWKEELRNGWANFSTMGFAQPGNYDVQYELVRFAVDEDRGGGYRCPDNDAASASVLFAGFTQSASDCQAQCVDLGNACRIAVFWSGAGATGYCELCDVSNVFYTDGYYRGSTDALVPVDGSDAREGRRPVSGDRFPTTVYVRRVYGDLREVVQVEVRPSVEFVARAITPQPGELLGGSVAIGEGGVVVSGAYVFLSVVSCRCAGWCVRGGRTSVVVSPPTSIVG